MAENPIRIEGKDGRDRRMMNDMVRHMGRALRQMHQAKIISRSPQKVMGEYVWRIA